MILHTLNASPGNAAFADCLRLADSDDAILLLGDGVYGALPESAACALLQDCPATVYVLRDDASAAGVAVGEAFAVVDMAGFVALTERFTKQVAWY